MNISKIDDLRVYNLNNKIDLKKYYILLIITILFFVFIIIYPYQNISTYKLIVDNSYKLIVDDNFFPIKNNYLYINNKKYNYNVAEISEQKIIDNKIYYELKIDINLKVDTNIIPVIIKRGKTTLFNKFVNNLKGW